MKGLLCTVGLALGMTAAFGCGRQPEVAPVSGLVTLDGQPLAGAHVSFQPVQDDVRAMAMGSYDTTSSEGRYSLRLVEPDMPGAVPGQHRVRIRTAVDADQPEDGPLSEERLPARYRDGTLTFEVPASGTTSADFHLRSH